MTKKDLALELAVQLELTDVQAKRAVKMVLRLIADALVAGEKLEFRGFGVFKTKIRKARLGRNPKANTSVNVPERGVVVFKMGKELKERVRNHSTIP